MTRLNGTLVIQGLDAVTIFLSCSADRYYRYVNAKSQQNPEQNNFKGIVSRDGYFLKGYIMKSVLFVSALMVLIIF